MVDQEKVEVRKSPAMLAQEMNTRRTQLEMRAQTKGFLPAAERQELAELRWKIARFFEDLVAGEVQPQTDVTPEEKAVLIPAPVEA